MWAYPTLRYDEPLYRPPSEGHNLIIQATIGCSFNRCTFSSMYKSKTFRARPLADVFADIEAAARLSPNAPRIFLADGDALVLPADGLAAIPDKLAATFPALERVSCYATPINLMHKPIVELCSPRAKKLLLVYQMVRGRIYLTKPQFERLLASAQQPSQARQPCRVYCD